MIAACSLCNALIEPAPVQDLGPHRDGLEWRALGDRMMDHVVREHPLHFIRITAMMQIFTHWLISFLFLSPDAKFETARDTARNVLLDFAQRPVEDVARELAAAVPGKSSCQHSPKRSISASSSISPS